MVVFLNLRWIHISWPQSWLLKKKKSHTQESLPGSLPLCDRIFYHLMNPTLSHWTSYSEVRVTLILKQTGAEPTSMLFNLSVCVRQCSVTLYKRKPLSSFLHLKTLRFPNTAEISQGHAAAEVFRLDENVPDQSTAWSTMKFMLLLFCLGFCSLFETGSYSVAQAGVELTP